MKAFIAILLLSIFFGETVSGQSSDVLVLKRRDGRRMASYMQGSGISFLERSGARFSGRIVRIDQDTIRFEIYDIRRMTTMTGGVLFDTVARMPVRVDYRDIVSVVKPSRSFGFISNGRLLKWSGIGFGTLHLLNAAISKEPVLFPQIAAAGAVTTTGYLLGFLYKDSYVLGRKYQWQYLDL
jgi:hypothetical protein